MTLYTDAIIDINDPKEISRLVVRVLNV